MADNNIVIRITSEAELTDAQLQLRELTDLSKKYEQEMKALQKAEQEDLEYIKERVKAGEAEAASLAKNEEYYRGIRKEKQAQINATKKSIEAINKEVKAYKMAENGGKKLALQLREMREQLMKMEDAGDATSQAYIDLSVAAAKLQDQLADTQERIRILSSDTLALDAAMSAGSGLSGAFNTATSALAVFGGEAEELEKAFYKVQAVLSVINGLQEIQNTLNKESAINVAISTKMSNLHAVAMAREAVAAGKATAAQKLLNFVMKLNPFGVILTAITAIVGILTAFSGELEGVGRKIRALFDGVAGFFSKTYEANRKAQLAMEEYERTATRVGRKLNALDIIHKQHLHGIEQEEQNALNAAKKRHATSLETSQVELKYLKQRRLEIAKYTNDAITANNEEIRSAKAAVDAQRAALQRAKGLTKQTEAREKLSDAERTYYDLVQKGLDLENERRQADQAVIDKEQQIADERISLRRQTEQALIDAMRDGEEKELRQLNASYEQQLIEAGKGTALYNALIAKKAKEEADIKKRYNAQALTEYAEALRIEMEGDQFNYDKKIAYYQQDAVARMAALDKNKMSEEEYANEVASIQQDLNRKLKTIQEQRTSETIQELQRAVEQQNAILNNPRTIGAGKTNALEARFEAEKKLFDQQEKEARLLYDNGTISYQDYQDKLLEISKARIEAEITLEQEKATAISDTLNKIMDNVSQAADMMFEALNINVQKQLDALDKFYTTDADEAARNADKKYLTEKQYEKKKAELTLKQQKLNKASSLFQIGIQTAMAIMNAMATAPWPVSIIQAALAGTMGAAQLAIAAAKPLPQYAKGRNGGPGEYALVGEKGPELMYVPEGASIVPNSKLGMPGAWAAYGVPELPNGDAINYASLAGISLDYDKLGKAVAENLPKSESVIVNVDRGGVAVTRGRNTRTYLNTKYAGSWN